MKTRKPAKRLSRKAKLGKLMSTKPPWVEVKPVEAWAVMTPRGRICGVGMCEMSARDEAQIREPEYDSVKYKCIPVTITPGRGK